MVFKTSTSMHQMHIKSQYKRQMQTISQNTHALYQTPLAPNMEETSVSTLVLLRTSNPTKLKK